MKRRRPRVKVLCEDLTGRQRLEPELESSSLTPRSGALPTSERKGHGEQKGLLEMQVLGHLLRPMKSELSKEMA